MILFRGGGVREGWGGQRGQYFKAHLRHRTILPQDFVLPFVAQLHAFCVFTVLPLVTGITLRLYPGGAVKVRPCGSCPLHSAPGAGRQGP